MWAALTDPLSRFFASPVPEGMGLGLYAVNLILTCGIALALVVFIDGERVRAKGQSQALLLNILPDAIVDRLKARRAGHRRPLPGGDGAVRRHRRVHRAVGAHLDPPSFIAMLNKLFSGLRRSGGANDLEKIKTIGDAYMAVGGAPDSRTTTRR